MAIILGDIAQSELLEILQLFVMATHNQPARWDMKQKARIDGDALDYYRDRALTVIQDLANSPEPEPKKVDIDFADYLDTASLLIALEVARQALGDMLRRSAIIQPMGLPETDADIIRIRLTRLMNAIRSTEKSLPKRDFPALESRSDEDAL